MRPRKAQKVENFSKAWKKSATTLKMRPRCKFILHRGWNAPKVVSGQSKVNTQILLHIKNAPSFTQGEMRPICKEVNKSNVFILPPRQNAPKQGHVRTKKWKLKSHMKAFEKFVLLMHQNALKMEKGQQVKGFRPPQGAKCAQTHACEDKNWNTKSHPSHTWKCAQV